MSISKNIGAPNKSTAGAVGDIYLDITTGDEYKCIFAYRDNLLMPFNYSWKKIKEGDSFVGLEKHNEEPKEESVEESNETQAIEEDFSKFMNKPIDVPEKPRYGKRDYANAYKQKNK